MKTFRFVVEVIEGVGFCLGATMKEPYLMLCAGFWLIVFHLIDIREAIEDRNVIEMANKKKEE